MCAKVYSVHMRVWALAIMMGLASGTPFHAAQAPQRTVDVPMVRPALRALYLTSSIAASARFDAFMARIQTGEINALVIDLKDANGRLAFTPSNAALAR